jgi:histidyl-tRNA synthetase
MTDENGTDPEGKARLQSIRGMKDILPAEAEFWETVEHAARDALRQYGYRPIRTPVVEATPLFKRAIGEVTDIVEKEMYSFQLSGEPLSLRPEGTAGCARAVIEHGLAGQSPQRFYYLGPMFRHERPQKDRYRQFHQIGGEAFGFPGPDVDAEQILMLARLWKRLGLEGRLRLQLNSLGVPEERLRHRADLLAYLERHQERLDADARRRLPTNPLRILDSKNPELQDICAQAPRLTDYLGDDSRAHFEGIQHVLTAAGIAFEINHRLVRGLDYYNHTVFEWVTEELGAQGTVCAGGRYDGLVAQLGGKPTPACGFAIGMERLISLMQAGDVALRSPGPQIYIAHQGEAATRQAFQVAESLRDLGFRTILHCGGGSFKSQLKKADASGARFAVIIGDDEAARGEVQLKALRDATFGQQRLVLADAADILRKAHEAPEEIAVRKTAGPIDEKECSHGI